MMEGAIRIYGLDQVSASDFLVPDNMEAAISVPVARGTATATLRFTLRFVPSEGALPVQSNSWVNDNGTIKFTFVGWTNAFGTSFTEPFKLGDVSGAPFFVQIAHRKIGDTLNHVTWYVFLGAQ
jgi:hypothetical protein